MRVNVGAICSVVSAVWTFWKLFCSTYSRNVATAQPTYRYPSSPVEFFKEHFVAFLKNTIVLWKGRLQAVVCQMACDFPKVIGVVGIRGCPQNPILEDMYVIEMIQQHPQPGESSKPYIKESHSIYTYSEPFLKCKLTKLRMPCF